MWKLSNAVTQGGESHAHAQTAVAVLQYSFW